LTTAARVIGVKYKTFEGDRCVRARKGVLISTGASP